MPRWRRKPTEKYHTGSEKSPLESKNDRDKKELPSSKPKSEVEIPSKSQNGDDQNPWKLKSDKAKVLLAAIHDKQDQQTS